MFPDSRTLPAAFADWLGRMQCYHSCRPSFPPLEFMEPSELEQLKEVFYVAIQQPPEQRPQFLAEACGGDENLRAEVARLLTEHDDAGGFLESPFSNVVSIRSLAESERTLETNQMIAGRYRIVSLLGEGGMGVVYKAEDTRLPRSVALKSLGRAVAEDAASLARLRREAQAASTLNHPNICTIYDVVESEGQTFIVMEYLEGQTLKEMVKSGCLSAQDARPQRNATPHPLDNLLRIATQIIEGIEAAHDKGIVHRDIKPANIFVTKAELVKILDFGIATMTAFVGNGESPANASESSPRVQEHLTTTGVAAGTIGYMSPEQVGAKELDARTDLFSFGAVLYEMTTGTMPFAGQNTKLVLDSILTQESDPAASLNPNVPPKLGEIIGKCLQKDRDLRYQSASEVRRDLQQLKLKLDGKVAHGFRRLSRRGWIVAGLVTAILIAFGLWFAEVHGHPTRPTQIRSLAVLPLRDLSPDSGQEYFADGITEELITNLAQSLPLRVISRTSVLRYRQTGEPIAQIAQELGVEAVVEGAVTRSGKRVAVMVQLIDATEDRHLWAHKYDRDIGDLLSMEAELSREIANQVGATLNEHSSIKLAKSRPVDPQLYELCLLARYHWNKRSAAGLTKSVEYYQQAIARDPTYAPAYAGLANAYALLPAYEGVGLRNTYAKAVSAARKAIELDDTLADAHATLGLIGLNYGPWDPVQVEKELRRALELNSNYASAHHWFAFYLRFTGRSNEALEEIERARQLDPLSAIVNCDQGFFLYGAGRFKEARVRLRQAMELAPELGSPHIALALIEWESGHPADAAREARAALTLDGNDPSMMADAGYVLAVTGHTAEAVKLLAGVQNLVHRGSASPRYAASIELGLGQREQAIDSLQEMPKLNFGAAVPGLVQWHYFNQLKTDSRYQKLVAQGRH
jgi:eukaryotic-like serine/threonine-protein kinase